MKFEFKTVVFSRVDVAASAGCAHWQLLLTVPYEPVSLSRLIVVFDSMVKGDVKNALSWLYNIMACLETLKV